MRLFTGLLTFLFAMTRVTYAQQAELMLPVAHNSPITGVTISSDNRYVATSGADEKLVKLWERATGRLLKTFMSGDQVNSVCFSPDSKYLLITANDQHAKVWEIQSGSLYYDIKFEFNNWIQNGGFTGDSKKVILIADNAFEVHDLATRTRLNLVRTNISYPGLSGVMMTDSSGHKIWIDAAMDQGKDILLTVPRNAAIARSGNYLLTVGTDSTMRLWDLQRTEPGQKSIGPKLAYHDCVFSNDDRQFLAINGVNEIRIWNTATTEVIRSITSAHGAVLFSQFNADGTEVITSSTSSAGAFIDRWNIATGKLIKSIPVASNEYCFFIQASNNGKWIIAVTTDGNITIYSANKDSNSAKVIDQLKQGIKDQIGSVEKKYFGYVNACFSPDSRYIVSSSINTIASIYDLEQEIPGLQLEGLAAGIAKPVYSNNGKMLATIGTKENYRLGEPVAGVVSIWNLSTARKVLSLEGHEAEVNDIAFSHDDKYLASASDDGTVRIWNLGNGQTISILKGHEKPAYKCYFSPDDKYVVTQTSFGLARVFETETGKLLYVLRNMEKPGEEIDHPVKGRSIYYTQVSSNNRFILARYYDDNYIIRELSTGKTLYAYNSKTDSLNYITLDPTGKFLRYTKDSSIYLADAGTGKIVLRLTCGSNPSDVAFSKSGNQLACLTARGDLITWSIPSGKITGTVSTKLSKYTEIFFSPNEKYLFTSSYDSLIRVWDAQSLSLVEKINVGPNDHYQFSILRNNKTYVFTRSTEGILKAWDLETGKLLSEAEDKNNPSLRFTVNPSLPEFIIDNHVSISFYRVGSSSPVLRIIPTSNNDYLVTDSLDRYDGTEAAKKLIYFTCGTEVIELDQVKEQLWIPGLAERIMKGEDINSKTLGEMDICRFTPLVEEKEANAAGYKFRISPQRGGLGDVIMLVNGIEARHFKISELLKSGDGYELAIDRADLKPYLIPGAPNPVIVKAFTKDNRIASRGIRVTAEEDTKSAEPPNLYAVMIGVSDYKGTELDLRYAAKDAKDISGALAHAAKKLLNADGKDHVFMYDLTTDAGHYQLPEKNAIRKVLADIGTKAKANDILLIFFAGHGVMDPETKRFYFLTADASQALITTSLPDVGISTTELADWMQPQQIKAQKRILVLDACNSGQAIKDLVQIGNKDQQFVAARGDDKVQQAKAIDHLNEKAGLFILSASASNQSAYELGEYAQGLLTYSLLKAIKEQPDILEDGKYLNVSRWFNAAEKTVSDISRENGARQEPQIVSNTNFNVGIVDDEVISSINIPGQKLLFTTSNLQNADENIATDDLGLNKLIDQHLSLFSSRGDSANISFNANTSKPDAFVLGGRYEVKEKKVNARVNIRMGKEIKFRFEVTGDLDHLQDLADDIAKKAAQIVK